jgi:SNF2 family DNA or RNA helicase
VLATRPLSPSPTTPTATSYWLRCVVVVVSTFFLPYNEFIANTRTVGLNLTMASRVIMMDPWWNSASEQQAFCRVFRIGQNNETYMSRLCVRNSVDAHLIAMQERKQKEINGVMEEDISRVKK